MNDGEMQDYVRRMRAAQRAVDQQEVSQEVKERNRAGCAALILMAVAVFLAAIFALFQQWVCVGILVVFAGFCLFAAPIFFLERDVRR